MSRLQKGIIFGLVTGILGLILNQSPFGLPFEENIGLSLLFKIRGTRKPPPDVVIVTMDEESAEHFNLPTNPEKWPHALHTNLIRKLKADNASVITFDLFFKESHSPKEDTVFSGAIRDAQNVVLSEYLEKKSNPLERPTDAYNAVYDTEKLIRPLDVLSDSALALAPFPLPKTPTKLCKYWTFKESIGNIPTLPVVSLQVHALDAYPEFIQLLKQVDSNLVANLPKSKEAVLNSREVEVVVRHIRDIAKEKPYVISEMLAALEEKDTFTINKETKAITRAMLRMYQGKNTRYLNFYGPPGTIPTVCYHSALGIKKKTVHSKIPMQFENKAVFIGLSERFRTDQKDGFFTVFSQENGIDLSGVEIAATAFANLLEDMPVRPLMRNVSLLFLLFWGGVLGVVCYLFSTLYAGIISVGMGLLYLGFIQVQFNNAAMWYPLSVPLFIQIPSAFFTTVLWKYRETKKERQYIRKAFGYYLPNKVVDQLSLNMGDIRTSNQSSYGTCLFTDGGQYTTLSETMEPASLSKFMNRYYETLFEPVKEHGGIVINVVGDSMLAVWATSKPDIAFRQKACLAALDIDRNIRVFNRSSNGVRLPTRIGLHSGHMQMGSIGALDHYEYRPIGDIVNTASRMEGLNKYLGTRVLVSNDVLNQLEDFYTRALGVFLFKGKTTPVAVYELLGLLNDIEEPLKEFSDRFAEALHLYEIQTLDNAKKKFNECLEIIPNDGPSLFYIKLCEKFEKNPIRGEWDSAVHLDDK